MAKLMAGAAPPALLREVGEAFATLHGAVSRGSAAGPSRRLFRSDLPWALTLGAPDMRFAPTNQTAAALLGEIMRRPDGLAGLGRARAEYRTEHVIHGDAKAANILILDDGSIRLIDWEIATLGDGLWDLAGMVHSLLLPNPMVPQEPLPVLRARAAPALEALCGGYAAVGITATRGDWRETVLRLAGARILQTCLECVYYPGPMPPAIPSLLAVAFELLTRPQAWKEGWRWAA
jgi:Ser/Thr protein kinase RdoA (MazF antagonist)